MIKTALGLIGLAVACAGLGGCATGGGQQPAATAKGYVIGEIAVTDQAAYDRYRPLATALVAKAGGRYLVRGAASTALEGAPADGRLVIIEFESVAAAEQFYRSPDYQAIIGLRQQATRSRILLAPGVPQP